MIGALTGGEGLGGGAVAFVAGQLPSVGGLGGLSGGEGAGSMTGAEGGASQSTATISGPGQLLSDLQQLQTQNPTAFTQVVGEIAGQLSTAAQQAQGQAGTFLSNLATAFQNVANGGSLSQLQLQMHSHHHSSQQTYSQNGQSQSLGVGASGQANGNQSASMQQLFATISGEVASALAG